MLVTIHQGDFASMDDASLIWTCIEPTIRQIRGRDHTVKLDAYDSLTAGQRALLMFQIMNGHTRGGIGEFYTLIPYLPSGKGIWPELKKSMEYFGASSMLRLLCEMEKDCESMVHINQHNLLFYEAIPAAIKLIAGYIRENPSEFVRFTESKAGSKGESE